MNTLRCRRAGDHLQMGQRSLFFTGTGGRAASAVRLAGNAVTVAIQLETIARLTMTEWCYARAASSVAVRIVGELHVLGHASRCLQPEDAEERARR